MSSMGLLIRRNYAKYGLYVFEYSHISLEGEKVGEVSEWKEDRKLNYTCKIWVVIGLYS